MGFTKLFIDRPILAVVISVMIMLVGGVAYFALPVSQYPEVAPPSITVTTAYPGANAETAAATVAAPLEQEINGVEGMLYLSSQSTVDGRTTITVTFALGTDLDAAQVLVQNRVNIALPRLPEEVRRLGVVTNKNTPDILMVVHLYSPDGSRDQLYLSNYTLLNIRDRLARLDGVGDLRLFGAREYSMRVWLDPNRIAALGLTAGEVVQALRAQNVQVSGGVLNRPPSTQQGAYEVGVQLLGRLTDPAQFGNVLIKTGEEGRLIRVRDVGRIELGAADYSTNAYLDDKPAVAVPVFQRPGSNALETARGVEALMASLRPQFPAGVDFDIIYNPSEFIAESVREVQKTIFEAAILVVVVIVLFLQSWRAAVIPLAAIPVSLIGTFAVLQAFGFSLNTLSLFGLVLAIGIVVDDAIVVVENAERNLHEGMTPRDAARRTMDEVGGALVAIALVLTAVFVPTAFIPGISGQFYRQFALTIASATLISCVVSLTLSPALAALLLRPRSETARSRAGRWFNAFFRHFNTGFDRLSDLYGSGVARTVRVSALMLVVYGGLLALTGVQFWRAPGGFIPAQDQGYFVTVVQLPPGSSLARTDAVVQRAIEDLLAIPGVAHTASFSGFDGASFTNASNSAAVFFTLAPFDERAARGIDAAAVLSAARQRMAAIAEANIFVIAPPSVRGLSATGGFKMIVQDRSATGLPALRDAAGQITAAAAREPGLVGVFSQFEVSTPQVYVDIDRDRAQALGVPPSRVFEALEVFLGSAFVNDFNYLGRTYRVTAQADSQFRRTARNVSELRTRSDIGGMVPLGSVATFRDVSGPTRVTRYNLYPGVEVLGDVRPGTSFGQGLDRMAALATASLPEGFSYEWTELAFQQQQAGNTAAWVFVFAVVVVFLVLAGQYESLTLPLAVVLIVPMCLLAAITGVLLRGQDNNILTQIGLVVLVGLACKNAILIVEFARQAEDQLGLDRFAAAAHAARQRLRPILMTSLAFILGVAPLVFATGAGAEARQALGTAVFAGMIGVTIFGLLFTPVFYVVCRRLVLRREQLVPAVATVLLMAISGCSVRGTDIKAVEPAPAAAFEAATNDALATTGPVDAWWTTFEDARMTSLVEQALNRNLDVRQAAALVRLARARLREREGTNWPFGGASAGFQHSRSQVGPGPVGDVNLFDAGLDASWEVDIFGARSASIAGARADFARERSLRRLALVSVAAEVVLAYTDVRGTQARLAVARDNVVNQESASELTRQLLDAGRGTQLDVDRAVALLESTRASIPPLVATESSAIYRLAVLVGSEPQALAKSLRVPEMLPSPPDTLALGEPATLLRRRSDVAAAEYAVLAAAARAGVAAAELFPRLVLTGGIGLQGFGAGDATNRGPRFGFGLGITLPFLEWNRIRQRILAADATAEIALADYERTALLALEEAERAITAYVQERERFRHLDLAARSARAAAGLARQRFQFGADNFLTVLDAERVRLEAEDQLARSRVEVTRLAASIFKALGGGWSEAERLTSAQLADDDHARLQRIVEVTRRGDPGRR
jgi:hydrophobe/amphiphile efflux-1 (HAE1) family protein/NodT family efflux transporter outer membrane factor (OMF) lipoprotein